MSIDIEKYAQGGFALLERKELFSVAKQVGVKAIPSMSDDDIREALMRHLGEVAVKLSPRQTGQLSKVQGMPNLTSNGTWGGRRRRIQLIATEEQAEKARFHPVRWENSLWYLPFNREIDIPYPHYNILKQTIGSRMTSVLERRPNGEQVAVKSQNTFVRIPFQDLGDTPGTESLPKSMVDYFHDRAENEDNFSGIPRQKLIQWLAMLKGPQGPTYYKDRTDDEIRSELLGFIGIWPDLDVAA